MESSMQPDISNTHRSILRKYYLENDYFMTTEGILKVLSIVLCTVSSMSFLWGGWCNSDNGAGAAGVSTLSAAAGLALCACAVFFFAENAPMTCFVIDLILYTIVGVSLFLFSVLSVTLCEIRRPIDYVYGPLALINSALAISSAVTTYIAVSKKWDTVTVLGDHRPSQDSIDELEV